MLPNHQTKVLFSRVEDFYSCDPTGATLRAFPTFVSSPRGVRPRPLRANGVWSLESCEQNQLRANQDFFLPCKNANANMAFLASESLDRATRFRVGVERYASRMGSVLLRKKYLISVLHLSYLFLDRPTCCSSKRPPASGLLAASAPPSTQIA